MFDIDSELRKVNRGISKNLRAIDRNIKVNLKNLIGSEIGEEKRVPIPSKTKKAVYERAKGRCECCGRPLKMSDTGAHFHHLKKPTTRSRPQNVQFLCALCHNQYGHEYKSRIVERDPIIGKVKKEVIIKRKKVRKRPSPYWKMATKKQPRNELVSYFRKSLLGFGG